MTEKMLMRWRKGYEKFMPKKELRSFSIKREDEFLPNIADAIATVLGE